MIRIKLFVIGLFICLIAQAQVTFIVENNSSTKTFATLQEAIDGAVDGDIVYLPGGSFPSPGTVNKSLTWIGTGHYPAGTTATGPTQITGSLTLTDNCDNSYFEGIYFTQHFYMGRSGEVGNITDVTIKRCRIDGDLRLKYNTTDAAINFVMSECVTKGNITGNNASNCLFEKTILSGRRKSISSISQSNFDRLISTDPVQNGSYGTSYCFQYVTNSTISNCIFNRTYNTWQPIYCTGNTFKYNLFAASSYNLNGNTDINNMEANMPFTDLFVSVSDLLNFSYTDDFHLKAGVPGINAAEDGTNVGLYGSSTPAKTYAIPSQPHISSKSIASSTDNAGLLNINIVVEAQDN